MASLVRSESLTIWPWSVASFATQCFNSTISPASLTRTPLISAAEAATRLRFCNAKSDVLDTLDVLVFRCCARAACECVTATSKSPAATNKLHRFVVCLRSKNWLVRLRTFTLLRTGSCDAERPVTPPGRLPPGLNEYQTKPSRRCCYSVPAREPRSSFRDRGGARCRKGEGVD